MNRSATGVCLLLLTAAAVASVRCGPTSAILVDRADIIVRVEPSGSAEVEELLTVRATDTTLTEFNRRVATDHADRIEFISASLDGELLQPNGAGDRLSVRDGARLDVRWSVPPTDGVVHRFGLRYRAVAAVAVSGARGSFRLPVVVGDGRLRVADASLRLELPEGVGFLQGTGVAEAGWTVEATSDGITANRRNLGPDETATLVAEMPVDRAVVNEPVWQIDRELGGELAPAFVSGGLFILVIGAGVLWILRFQYPSDSVARQRPGHTVPAESERQAVRAGLRTGGFVCLGFAAVAAVIVPLTLGHLGIWPMALPLGILIVGVAFVGLGPRIV